MQYKILPLFASNVVGSFTLNLSWEQHFNPIKRVMKSEDGNQRGEQPNATAFTQVSHLLKATLISLPVSATSLMMQIPAKSFWDLSPLAQQLLLLFLPLPLPLSFLSHFASLTSKHLTLQSEKEKTLGESVADEASTTVDLRACVIGPRVACSLANRKDPRRHTRLESGCLEESVI